MFLSGPEDAANRYGEIRGGVWLDESKWCSVLKIPDDIGANWINSFGGSPVKKIYCNKDFQDPLLRALQNVKERGLLPSLNTMDGCYSIRPIRGELSLQSAHSWGIAIDLNAKDNALGTNGNMSDDFVRCFTDSGLYWGGAFKRKDPMHFGLGF